LWPPPLKDQLAWNFLQKKELSNNVISSECDRDKINEEHNTKGYDFKE
jgi:hypothetical protein